MSAPLQITLGVLLVSCKLVDSLVILENLTISYNPKSVPILYVLITCSRQHGLFILGCQAFTKSLITYVANIDSYYVGFLFY